MNWIMEVAADYFSAVIRYWWLLVPGILMPIPDIYKALHPQGKQLEIPRPLKIVIFAISMLLAQFFAYKDSIKNLSNVIVEKRDADSQNVHLRDTLNRRDAEIGRLTQQLADLGVKPTTQIDILYEGRKLNGRTVTALSAFGNSSKSVFALAEFKVKNNGSQITDPLSARFYLSRTVQTITGPAWQPTTTDERGYPIEFYAAGNPPIQVHPTETWNWIAFTGQVIPSWDDGKPIRAKLKIFSGSAAPTVAKFTIVQGAVTSPAH